MATVTISPTNYWQVDFGTVTAKNPAKKRISYGDDQYGNHIAKKRVVFLEFSVPTNAAYRHAIVTVSKLLLAPDVTHLYVGYRNDYDLNLSVGKSVISAGYPEIFNKRASGGGNMSATDEISSASPPTLIAYNNRFYIGILNPYNNAASPHYDFEWSSAASLELTYTVGAFAITPNVTGGYLSNATEHKIKIAPNNIANMMTQYTVKSGTFFYKKSSASSYSQITFSGDTVTIPAYTFEANSTYSFYFTGVSDTGSSATSSTYSFSTNDVVGTTTAVSPNNMITYGSVTFRWTYDNSLGNPQRAFDLQTSTDQSTWTNLVSHRASTATTYTATINTAGKLYWKVRSYNQGDVVNGWSAALPFTNVLPPTTPTITSVNGTGRITVGWTATAQVAYQVVVGQYDSGWVYSTAKTHFLNQYLKNGGYQIKVRIANNLGLVSDWATLNFTQTQETTGPSASIEMDEGFNRLTFSGDFQRYYILRNGVPVAETTGEVFEDYYCNGNDEYVVRGVKSDDSFGDTAVIGQYVCRKPALITLDNQILYVNERLDEQPQISSSETLDISTVEYLGRSKPVHHTGIMITRKWSVTCSRNITPGQIYFYRNFRGDKAWIICSNIQSVLNWIGVHEYQYTLEETDFNEAIEYAV